MYKKQLIKFLFSIKIELTQIHGITLKVGRMGSPLELAKAAVFLASDESSFVLGTELLVDGGVRNL